MAWTVPMTFTAETVLTAAQLNTHLRDNLLETCTARATESGQVFIAQGKYKISARKPEMDEVNTAETAVAGTGGFADLTTPGPSVTVRTGTRAFVWISCESESTSAAASRVISWAIDGDTERDALDSTAIRQDGNAANNGWGFGSFDMITTLTPGINTFTMKYKVGSGTCTFRNRQLVVWPL